MGKLGSVVGTVLVLDVEYIYYASVCVVQNWVWDIFRVCKRRVVYICLVCINIRLVVV